MCLEPETESESANHERDRQDLEAAILAVQTTIEHTLEEDTRVRMRTVLKALQRVASRFELERPNAPGANHATPPGRKPEAESSNGKEE